MSTTTTRSQRLTLICTLFVLMGAPVIIDAVTCVQVTNNMAQCVPYISSGSSLGHCCGGIKRLNAAAKTKGDRQQICRCLKTIAAGYRSKHTLNFNDVKRLPTLCKINIHYMQYHNSKSRLLQGVI